MKIHWCLSAAVSNYATLREANLILTFEILRSAERGANLDTCMQQGLTANLQTHRMAQTQWLVQKSDTGQSVQPFNVTQHRSNVPVL